MAQSIYGGRVDNEFDQRLLNTFLERLFTTRSFDSEFKLACKVDGHKDIQMPDGIRYGCLWGTEVTAEGAFGASLPNSDSKCPAFSGERSSCSGWSCCLMPRHPRGWACPTMLRGSCLPPKVGRESLHFSRAFTSEKVQKGGFSSRLEALIGAWLVDTQTCALAWGKSRKTRVQCLVYTACPRLRLHETMP